MQNICGYIGYEDIMKNLSSSVGHRSVYNYEWERKMDHSESD